MCVLHNGGDKKLVVFEYLIYRTEDINDGSTLLQIVSFLTGVVFFTERFYALLLLDQPRGECTGIYILIA